MKVLHINTLDTGGAANACVNLHLALLENGVKSHLLTLSKTRGDIPKHSSFEDFGKKQPKPPSSIFSIIKSRIRAKLIKDEITEEEIYNENLESLRREASKVIDYFSLINSPYRLDLIPGIEEYDIINLHWVANFLDWETFFLSPKVNNIVWTLHDFGPFTGGYHYTSGFDGYKYDDLYPPFLQNTFDPAFASKQLTVKKNILAKSHVNIFLVSPSKCLKIHSQESSLFSQKEHFHIPYSLNINIFKCLDKSFCRQVLNLPLDKKIILFVSDFLHNQRKGFDMLLEALEMLNDKGYILCCIGNRSDLDFIPKGTIYLGRITDERLMTIAYNSADVFVLPAKEDNLPNTVLESLCCGTPVVGYNVGGMSDMVINNFNGELSSEISSKQLLVSIQKVITNLENYNKNLISIEARKQYSPSVQAKAYVKVYKELLM